MQTNEQETLDNRARCTPVLVGVCVAASAMTILGGCYKVVSTADSDSIGRDRDVVIEGLIGNATSLAAIPGGGLAVAGYSWAVATDANGRELWRYLEPDADATKTTHLSEFHGVVPLSNGNILLCGIARTPDGSAGLLTILNSAGHLVEKRLLQPPGPDKYSAVRFDRCLRWDDGIAVSGGFANDRARVDWLMKLDGNGAKQWDLFDYGVIGIDAVESVNHNLVTASSDLMARRTKLVQINPQGHIVSTKALSSYPDNMVRSAVPASTLKVQTNINRAHSSIITFNDELEEIASPISAEIIMTGKGCAWVLSDGSVALFGNVFAGGGVYRAAAARVGQPGKPDAAQVWSLPSPASVSASVYDAIPISDRTFVAVRDLNNSVVLSWVTFK